MQTYSLLVALFTTVTALAAAAPQAPEKKLLPPVNVGGLDAKDGTGAITGVVRFKGQKPEPKPLTEIAGNAFCKQCYKEGELPLRDDVVVGKAADGSDTLQNVLVYVSKGLPDDAEFDPPSKPVVLDQIACVYTPHVVAVMAGQTLEIRNSDPTLHNVMTQPRENPPFNVGMPVKDQVIKKVFKAPEFRMNFRCFMHPWMSAYVHVLEHPFFAVTAADGSFTLQGLPPGEYELTALHESSALEATPATAKVKVAAGETAKAEFTYQSAGAKP